MPKRIDWDRHPVSIHSEDKSELEDLIEYLKTKHSILKRSIIMDDRESGGFLFLYTNHVTLDGLLNFITGENMGDRKDIPFTKFIL